MNISLVESIDECLSTINEAISANSVHTKKRFNFKYLVVLDFEATCDKNKGAFKPIEIIEWPAIIIDMETKKIYSDPKDYFHVYVKPKHHPKLTQFCTELTGITQSMLDNGIYIEEALDLWNMWCYDHDLLPNEEDPAPRACIVTCGDWDLQQMWSKQCKLSSFRFNKPAMLFAAWINVKKVFKTMLARDKVGGMMSMLNILNIAHFGRHHSGIDDVKNICNIVVELLNRNQNSFYDYTTYTNSKDMHRSLFDDFSFANQMNKICPKTHRNDDSKPQISDFISRPKTLPTARVQLPWIEHNNIHMKVVMFHSSKKDIFGAQFSCLFPSEIIIDTNTKIYIQNTHKVTTLLVHPCGDIKFKSAEHIFQCSKALNTCDDLFMRELTPFDCGKCGSGRLHLRSGKTKRLYESFGGTVIQKGSGKKKRFWLSESGYFALREHWDDIKMQVMYHALKQKFVQQRYLIEEYLMDDAPVYFIEHAAFEGDNLWADGGGSGKNWLGKLLTFIAWEMKYPQTLKHKSSELLLDSTFLKWMNTPNQQTCVFDD